MRNRFVKWCASFFVFLFYSSVLFGVQETASLLEEDTILVLEPHTAERYVSITGQLQRCLFNKNAENPELGTGHYWILKMDSKSFEIACSTPVHCAFESPLSIRNSLRSHELALTGSYDEKWLHQHMHQTVTLSGYLWHAHTAHHPTPIMMDTEPWFKNTSPCNE